MPGVGKDYSPSYARAVAEMILEDKTDLSKDPIWFAGELSKSFKLEGIPLFIEETLKQLAKEKERAEIYAEHLKRTAKPSGPPEGFDPRRN